MKIGIPAETHPGERRVAASPAAVARYLKLGFQVAVEAGAGAGASFPDDSYREAGAAIVGGDEAFGADVVLKVRAPRGEGDDDEVGRLREGAVLVSFVFRRRTRSSWDGSGTEA